MRSTTKSFANQYGITQKNALSNSSGGMGLNPNLNIQDEYIQNLLKQVHFLNMEIKLIKQKQKENKGMGIMGLLNKDQNPVVSHAVTSNAKYSDMKMQLSNMVNTAEVDHFRLDDENFSVKAQRDLTQKLSLKEEQKNIENKIYVDKVLGEAREKMNEQLKKLKELREQHRRTGDNHSRIVQQWQDLTTKDKTKKLMKHIVDNLETQVSTLRDNHASATEKRLAANNAKLEEADRLFRADPKHVKLVEESIQLKERVKVTDKLLFDKCYLAKEMEEKKKLAIRNRDVEAELKKQAVVESERLKKKLEDKRGEIEIKLKEARVALEGNDDIRLLKGKLARRDKEINDLRKKTEVSETNYKRLRDEVQKLQGALAQKKLRMQEKKLKYNELKTVQNEETVVLRQAELDFQKCSADYTNAVTNLNGVRKKLEEKEEELAYLTAKEGYLNKMIDLDGGLKSIRIDQLSGLMHSNSGLNETITSVMEKWEQIVKFSREPPSSV